MASPSVLKFFANDETFLNGSRLAISDFNKFSSFRNQKMLAFKRDHVIFRRSRNEVGMTVFPHIRLF